MRRRMRMRVRVRRMCGARWGSGSAGLGGARRRRWGGRAAQRGGPALTLRVGHGGGRAGAGAAVLRGLRKQP